MKKPGGTKVGKFLRSIKGVAPGVLELAGNITGIKALEKLGDAIKGETTLSPKEKETALKLLEMDLQEMQEISKRWSADMTSDSWLSKNVRPLVLIYLIVFMSLIIVSDSKTGWGFDVNDGYIKLLESLLITVVVAYFGSRGVEKFQKIKNK